MAIRFGSYRTPRGDGGKNGKRISAQQSVLVVSISQSAKSCFCPCSSPRLFAHWRISSFRISKPSSRFLFLKMEKRLSPLMMSPRPAAQLVACRNCSLIHKRFLFHAVSGLHFTVSRLPGQCFKPQLPAVQSTSLPERHAPGAYKWEV